MLGQNKLKYNIFSQADNYAKLIKAFHGMLPSIDQQAEPYVQQLSADVEKTEHAVKLGNNTAIVAVLNDFRNHTKAGAHHTKANGKLFNLINVIIPEQLLKTSSSLSVGEKTSNDVGNLIGQFAKDVKKATSKQF